MEGKTCPKCKHDFKPRIRQRVCDGCQLTRVASRDGQGMAEYKKRHGRIVGGGNINDTPWGD